MTVAYKMIKYLVKVKQSTGIGSSMMNEQIKSLEIELQVYLIYPKKKKNNFFLKRERERVSDSLLGGMTATHFDL